MPLGLVRKWTLVAMLGAAAVTTGCKDDDDDDTNVVDSGSPGGGPGGGDSGSPGGGGDSGSPGGGGDSGSPGGGGMDAGTDAAVTYEAGAPCPGWDGGPLTCGTNTCFWHRTTLTCSNPGCLTVNDASICAIDTTTLGGVDAGLPPLLPYDAPGADSPACGEVGDSFEAIPDGGIVDGGTKGNGKIDTLRTIMMIPIALRYPGCCTTAGYCSGNTGKGEASAAGTPYAASNAGYGCLDHRIFYATNANSVPTKCDVATGALVDAGSSSDAGGDAGAGDSGGGDAGDGG